MKRDKELDPRTQKLLQIATIRTEARAIWQGPIGIHMEYPDGELFYGWRTLSLEIRPQRADRLESRSVYANLFSEEQRFAVLRAAYWDGEAARKAIREGIKFKGAMPARFIQLPVEQLRGWLSEFNEVSVRVNEINEDDNVTAIRRLRIERNYASCIFEKVWQMQDANHVSLNLKWDRVWSEMTDVLSKSENISDLREDFWFVKPTVRYNLDAYDPTLLEVT